MVSNTATVVDKKEVGDATIFLQSLIVTPSFSCQRHHWNCRWRLQKWHNKSSGEESEEICFCTKRNPDVNSSPAIRRCHESGESDNNSIDRYLFNTARKITFQPEIQEKNQIAENSGSSCDEKDKVGLLSFTKSNVRQIWCGSRVIN